MPLVFSIQRPASVTVVALAVGTLLAAGAATAQDIDAPSGLPGRAHVVDIEGNSPSEADAAEDALPVQTMVGAGVGSAIAATTGLAVSAAVVGGIIAVFGTPQDPNDAATSALVAGAFFYALPIFATPAIGAFFGATIAGLLGGRSFEDVFVDAAVAGGVGFCGSALLLLPSWWAVSIPLLITFLIFGDAILLPALVVASAAFVPIWGTAGGAAAAGGVFVSRQLSNRGASEAAPAPAPVRSMAMAF